MTESAVCSRTGQVEQPDLQDILRAAWLASPCAECEHPIKMHTKPYGCEHGRKIVVDEIEIDGECCCQAYEIEGAA